MKRRSWWRWTANATTNRVVGDTAVLRRCDVDIVQHTIVVCRALCSAVWRTPWRWAEKQAKERAVIKVQCRHQRHPGPRRRHPRHEAHAAMLIKDGDSAVATSRDHSRIDTLSLCHFLHWITIPGALSLRFIVPSSPPQLV